MQRDERFVAGHTFKLSGLKCKYTYTIDPDTKYDACWKSTIVLTEDLKDLLKKAGFNVRQDNDGDWTLVAKRKVTVKSGKKQEPPKVLDGSGNAFDETIGNGSVCDFVIWGKYSNPKDPNQVVAYLNEIHVKDHVPYSGGPVEEFGAGGVGGAAEGSSGDPAPF